MTPDALPLPKHPADPVAALAEALRDALLAGMEWEGDDEAEYWHLVSSSASVALDAAGFAVVPKETAKRDLEECLRQNGYAIDLVQRNARLRSALALYGVHSRVCAYELPTRGSCICGFRAALAGGDER